MLKQLDTLQLQPCSYQIILVDIVACERARVVGHNHQRVELNHLVPPACPVLTRVVGQNHQRVNDQRDHLLPYSSPVSCQPS